MRVQHGPCNLQNIDQTSKEHQIENFCFRMGWNDLKLYLQERLILGKSHKNKAIARNQNLESVRIWHAIERKEYYWSQIKTIQKNFIVTFNSKKQSI